MTRLARTLLRLYPWEVRDRYGDEIAQLLDASPRRWRDALDVARHGLAAWRWWWLVPACFATIVTAWFAQPELYQLTVLPAAIAAFALAGIRLAAKPRPRWYQHPFAALICFSLIWFVGALVPGAIAYAATVPAALALVWLVHRWRSLALATLGWFALLEMAAVVWIVVAHPEFAARGLAWLPAALIGKELIVSEGGPILLYLPYQLLLIAPALAFALAFAYRSAANVETGRGMAGPVPGP